MMKKTTVTHSALVVVLLSAAGFASAAGTHTITVTASVTGTCLVNTATSTLDFGTLTPGSGTTANATGTAATFRCTNGTAYTITSDDGLNESAAGGANNRMIRSGAPNCTTATNCIRYTLSKVANGTGLGMGGGANNISFAITGQTLPADYDNAAAGSYSDTVTLTVSP